MNEQPGLFDCAVPSKHLARTADPLTSKFAAKQVFQFANTHHKKIYNALMQIKEGTFYQIAGASELDPASVWRRLNELEKAKMIHPTGENQRGPTGRLCRVWAIT